MDGQNPYTQRPLNNHPNAVKPGFEPSAPKPEQPNEPEAPLPKPKTEPVGPGYYKSKNKKGLWIAIALIILLLAAAAYWLLLKPKPVKAPIKTSSSNAARSTSTTNTVATNTAHYDSSNFNLGFDYPKGWKISDIAGSGKLTVTSPNTQFKDSDGQSVTGQIIMTIRDKTQKLTEFDKGNAAAILDSEKIAYTKPSQTQRGNTYISFLNYASSTGSNAAGIDGIYITGDAGYQKDQAIPLADISKIDPVINVTFLKDAKQVTIDSSNWSNGSFSKPLKSMLQSLAIQ
jgi:hypothetical protein